MSAVETMRQRAADQRARGNFSLADLFEQQIERGEEHCAQYIDMMRMIGRAAKRIRQQEE